MAVSVAPRDGCWALSPHWSTEHTATSRFLGRGPGPCLWSLSKTKLLITLVEDGKALFLKGGGVTATDAGV